MSELNLHKAIINIKYRNKLTGLLRLSKTLYYQSYFKVNQHNMKNIWTGIRQLVSLKKKASFRPNKLMKDGQDIIDPKLIANEFNNIILQPLAQGYSS